MEIQEENPAIRFNEAVETLKVMFEGVLSEEVIVSIVESYDGDLNEAVEAAMTMAEDYNGTSGPTNNTQAAIDSPPAQDVTNNEIKNQSSKNLANTTTSIPTTTTITVATSSASNLPSPNHPVPTQPTMSYAAMSQSTGAVQKIRPKPVANKSPIKTMSEEMKRVLKYHNEGTRVLVLVRGLPGSGKSHLAQQIVTMTVGATMQDFKSHIYSTDDFFMLRGVYQYNKYRLSEAHEWNQYRVARVLREGRSPVIVDNTNVEIWEMEPYLRQGVLNGYIIEVMEPNTSWARKANFLVKKNTHNVPYATIKRMLENFAENVTGQSLIKGYNLQYPPGKIPPVKRCFPPIENDKLFVAPSTSRSSPKRKIEPSSTTQSYDLQNPPVKSNVSQEIIHNVTNEIHQIHIENQPNVNRSEIQEAFFANSTQLQIGQVTSTIQTDIDEDDNELNKIKNYIEVQKKLEEIEKIDQEWEDGEEWEEVKSETDIVGAGAVLTPDIVNIEPKPPRHDNAKTEIALASEDLMTTVSDCTDWRQISMFMPPWQDPSTSQISLTNQELSIPVEKKSVETNIEIGDLDIHKSQHKYKILTTTPRDINFYYMGSGKEKIPEIRMLDKSTTTNEDVVTEAYRCKNEEKHFTEFRKLFKNIARADLRDIFDKCYGDVNWAVDITLDGLANHEFHTLDSDEISDNEDATDEPCECLAAYHIIPDKITQSTSSAPLSPQITTENATESVINIQPKKTKKEKIISESSIQLKRQIEQNVTIADSHYSEHYLKLRRNRRGESEPAEPDDTETTSPQQEVKSENELCAASQASTASVADEEEDCEDSESVGSSEIEKTVNVTLGMDFITKLDGLFGRGGMMYPEEVEPNINMPASLLNEINALWIESVMNQLEKKAKYTQTMIQQDEDFARQLAQKEAELAQAGREPEIPDFKEIMDMDLALSLHQKDIAEWRNNEPNDLAAKMSRDKLYNLFPEMSKDILSEMLMAHENNFQQTVEVLLSSTDRAHLLQEKNGVNKFVMEKEMERQEKLLAEEKRTLEDSEWPMLPQGEKVEMDTVENYREVAEKHLLRRNMNYQKAQDYIRRGMPQVANYYSDIANFHKQMFEQANSRAAASLIQVHASNSPDKETIDLHYLRVAEAKESVDLFIDYHIKQLKESRSVRHHTLFFITGRGSRSPHGPRIRPAVRRRLHERGLSVKQSNPGLLSTRVTAEDKLTFQLT